VETPKLLQRTEKEKDKKKNNLVLVQRTNFNGQMTHKKMGLGRTLMRKFVWKNFELCAVGTALSLLYLTGVISF
jgi:hypothetical protein